MRFRQWEKGCRNPPDLEDRIDKKFESTEDYYIKYMAKCISLQKIINEEIYIKDEESLRDLILQYIIDHNQFKVHFTYEFVKEVAEYMYMKAGYLHIRQFLDNEKKQEVKSKQKSIDELFWV